MTPQDPTSLPAAARYDRVVPQRRIIRPLFYIALVFYLAARLWSRSGGVSADVQDYVFYGFGAPLLGLLILYIGSWALALKRIQAAQNAR